MKVVTVDVDAGPGLSRVVYEDGSVVVVTREAGRIIARDFLHAGWAERRDGAR